MVCRLVIFLLDLGSILSLGQKLERRLEKIHIQSDPSINAGEAMVCGSPRLGGSPCHTFARSSPGRSSFTAATV